MKKSTLSALLLLALIMRANAAGDGCDEREKAEVRAIFKVLMQEVKEELPHQFAAKCIFGSDWSQAWKRADAAHDAVKVYPGVKVTMREALDPENMYSVMFCDREERDRLAENAGMSGAGESLSKTIETNSFDWSYPVFNETLTSATVDYLHVRRTFGGGKRYPLDGSSGYVRLVKSEDGNWTFRIEQTAVFD